MPRSLDLDRLRQFEPAAPSPDPTPQPARSAGRPPEIETKSAVPSQAYAQTYAAPARWPSREPQRDGQVSIKAPVEVIERFRNMCRDDRRTYADMLGILMDAWEGRR